MRSAGSQDERRQVVVSGLGCVTSLGCGREAFVRGLLDGRTGIRAIADFDVSASRATHAGRIAGFDPTAYLPPLKLRRVDAVARVAIAATRDALDDAGVPRERQGGQGAQSGQSGQGRTGATGDRIGVVLGSYSAGVHATGEYLESFMKGGPTGAPALLFSSTVGNAPASHCGLEYGLRGPNTTLMHKEASGLSAIVFGTHLVRRGKADGIVAGGADDIYERFYRVHDWFGVLAPPTTAPFDADRSGFVMGEGGYMLLLESADACAARGRPPLAEILGTGASASSCAINAWPGEPDALVRAMRLALEDAGLTPADVDVVYASANGTVALDRLESAAIRRLFGVRDVPVTSIKGAVGEFGAVGAASLAAAILCGREGKAAPTVGLRKTADDCPVAVVTPDVSRRLPLRAPVVLVNSFASGGTNFSVVARVLPA